MYTDLPMIDHLLEHELHVYFKYKHLDASDLVDILSNFNKLHNKLLSLSAPVYVHEDRAYRNFVDVTSINTGDSINFKLKEGWRPEFKIETGDLNVYVPKNLGIPALIFFLVLNTLQTSMGVYNSFQDMKLKTLELKIKELDLYKKLEEERRLRGTRSITQQVNKTVRFMVENPRITDVELNGLRLEKHQ
jgi:hypothetical protein